MSLSLESVLLSLLLYEDKGEHCEVNLKVVKGEQTGCLKLFPLLAK